MAAEKLSELGESALCYLGNKLSVFPVGPDKKPLVKWLLYQTQLSTEADVRHWWTTWPDANIGMACGPVSRFVVLDIDNEQGLQELHQRGLTIPETWTVKTGRGWHYYFTDPGVKTKNFAAGKREFPIPFVDFRGLGGYVVVPPSRHANGSVYRVEKDLPAVALPDWLLPLVRDPGPVNNESLHPASANRAAHNGQRIQLAEKILMDALRHASGGTRNETGLWLACQLRDNEFTEAEAESYVLRYAATVRGQGPHPYLDNEARETLRSAYSRPAREAWTSTRRSPCDSSGTRSGLSASATEEWPTLEKEALHGLVGAFVQDVAPYSEADPVAILLHGLVASGVMIGSSPRVLVEHQPHCVRMNLLLVGRTAGGRKGTAWSIPKHVLSKVDPEFVLTRVASGLSTGEGLISLVRDPRYEQEPIREGGKRTGAILGYEDVMVDPGEPDKRLLLIESEFASALKMLEREGNKLSPVIRDLWDHGNSSSLTKNNRQTTTGAHVAIIGHITRDELLRMLTTTERGNGFANRFLIALAKRSQFLPSGQGAPEQLLAPYFVRFLRTIQRAQTRGVLTRDLDAEALWTAIYPKLEEEIPGMTGAILARPAAQVLRLSMAYALLDEQEAPRETTAIRVPHLQAALALWDYCKASTFAIFGDAVGNPRADRLLRAIKTGPKTDTDLYETAGKHAGDSQSNDLALDYLLRLQRVHTVKDATTGGRPVRWWHFGILEKCALCAKRGKSQDGL